jgi:hypothetical protein
MWQLGLLSLCNKEPLGAFDRVAQRLPRTSIIAGQATCLSEQSLLTTARHKGGY